MFRHPKYYKELRKRNKTDQAISKQQATALSTRSPGSGQSLTRDSNADGGEGSSSKHQAIEETVPHCDIEEASSAKRIKQQAASIKPQATSIKLQATSGKLQDS
jgi:hypothetical protein